MVRGNNNVSMGGLTTPDTKPYELQVLADVIANPEFIPVVRERINLGMFADESTAKAWQTLDDMELRGKTIDMVTAGTVIDKDVLGEIFSPQFGFGSCGFTSIADHCTALAEMSLRRKLFVHSWELLRLCGNTGANIEGLLSMPGKMVEEINNGTSSRRNTKGINDVLSELSENLENQQATIQGGKRTRIPTGFPLLDKLTYSGFNAGNLVILSARPSVGKTAIMLHMAKSASHAGFPATIYSLEMTGQELAQRLLFSTEMVNPVEVINGTIDWKNYEIAERRINGLPLFVNDSFRTLEDIANDIVTSHSRGNCAIAFIDYLGLIQTSNTRQPLCQAIATITSRLKALAKECKIPIVLLCQLNRNSVADKRPPQLYDLRDSGAIEQDADIVLMLDRHSQDPNDPNVDMWVRKNRQGKAGDIAIELVGNKTFTDFTSR